MTTTPSTNQPPMKSAVKATRALQNENGRRLLAREEFLTQDEIAEIISRHTRHELAETVKPLVDALRDVQEILATMNWHRDRGVLQRIDQTLAHFDAAQGAQKEKL